MAERNPWIVSPRFDLALLAAPAVATAIALLLPRHERMPLWGFLLLVVAFDVAHVWATLYVSYLDREAFARRRLLFLLPIPITLLVSYRLHQHSPVLFWTLMAYVAIHHFAAQQWGFIALYKLRAGERDPLDRYLDKWTLWVGALGPVLWWHTSERKFDWFGHDEAFLFHLDPALRGDIAAVMVAFALVWLGRQAQHLRRGTLSFGKLLWMVAAWLSWSLGIALADNPLVSLAAINLLHGIPFLGLVWFRCNRRWEGRAEGAPSPLLARLSQRRALYAFYGLILLLALLEEGLWDGAVWGVYLAGLFDLPPPRLEASAKSMLVAALAMPQIVHYYLDAWLWKLDGSNPDLHEALGVPMKG